MKTTIGGVDFNALVGMFAAMASFVPKDTTAAGGGRVYLCQYRIEIEADRLTMIGTDGNRMAVVDCPCVADRHGVEPLAFGLDVHTVKVLQALFKTAPKDQKFATLEHDSEAKTLAFGIGSSMTPLALSEFASYPDWRRVMPRDGEAVSMKPDGDLFNAEYAADAFKSVHMLTKALGSKYPAARVKILQGDNGQQRMVVRMRGDRCNFTAVIMGMRG